MFFDPELAHKEQDLIKEIDRLKNILIGDKPESGEDPDFTDKLLKAIDENESELKKVRTTIRNKHQQERQALYRHLQGILLALVAIFILLAYKSLK